MNNWSNKSQAVFDTLHIDLKTLTSRVLQIHDCSLLWGHRDKDTQNALFDDGKSKVRYPDSKHNTLPSEAVDMIPYRKGLDPYGDDGYTTYFCGIVLGVAEQLRQEGHMRYAIRWGGSWTTERNHKFARFFDAYHFELFI